MKKYFKVIIKLLIAIMIIGQIVLPCEDPQPEFTSFRDDAIISNI